MVSWAIMSPEASSSRLYVPIEAHSDLGYHSGHLLTRREHFRAELRELLCCAVATFLQALYVLAAWGCLYRVVHELHSWQSRHFHPTRTPGCRSPSHEQRLTLQPRGDLPSLAHDASTSTSPPTVRKCLNSVYGRVHGYSFTARECFRNRVAWKHQLKQIHNSLTWMRRIMRLDTMHCPRYFSS